MEREMNDQDFIKFLPSEIMVDIISRLPFRTIVICKCVCKSWLNLLKSADFAQYHLSKSVPKSVPGLALQTHGDWLAKIYESVDLMNIHNLHQQYHIRASLSFDHHPGRRIQGSVHGLLFLCHVRGVHFPSISIVNPITSEYIKIDCSPSSARVSGFGVSAETDQYKVIWITGKHTKKCRVYTLGTGSWKSISNIPAHVHNVEYISYSFGAFVNGNLHWLAYDLNDRVWISCFDLEHEHFTIFASPLPPRPKSKYTLCLSAMDECLWLCDSSSNNELAIWVLKDYGDEKSWRKEFDLKTKQNLISSGVCLPIKVSEDGDSLVALTAYKMFHYSKKKNVVTICRLDNVYLIDYMMPMSSTLHTPSFLSLNSFANEKVIKVVGHLFKG